MTLRTVHRTSAIVIAGFACLHIANHVVGLAGASLHIAFMEVARSVYRQRLFEAVLLLCVSLQVISGLWFVLRGRKQRHGFVPWLQAISGAYLAFFLLVHVSAVLYGRAVLHLDTNVYFAAAGFHMPPFHFFFAPYYFLAVAALFAHLGCAAYWRTFTPTHRPRAQIVIVPVVVGVALSLLIVLSLAGAFYSVEVPTTYKDTYASQHLWCLPRAGCR